MSGVLAIGKAVPWEMLLTDNDDLPGENLTIDFAPRLSNGNTMTRLELSVVTTEPLLKAAYELLTSGTPGEDALVGSFHNNTVTLVRDDEFSDRFFLKTGSGDNVLIWTLGGDQLTSFTLCLRDLIDDISKGA